MITIRKMTEADVASVAQLEKICFSAPWSENSVRSELTNPLSLWLVAECDGTFAGYIGFTTFTSQNFSKDILGSLKGHQDSWIQRFNGIIDASE